ncbi:MAG: hypothetical protein ACAI44_18800, partial [Candidatus Sericytochromatia bacterium]
MKKLFAICVSATLTLSACSTTPSTMIQPGTPAARQSQATGSIKGHLVLPYRVQTTSRVAKAGFEVLAYVIGQPAQAQEVTDPAPSDTTDTSTDSSAETTTSDAATDTSATDTSATSDTSTSDTSTDGSTTEPASDPADEATPAPEASATDSGPLTEAEIQDLTATVDGQPVDLTVTDITSSEDETTVSYEITDAPVGDGMEVVEIQTPEGDSLGGVVVDVTEDGTTEQDITPETTALLDTAVEIHGSMKVADLT